MGKYFYNETSSINQIRKLEKDFDNIRIAIYDIGQTIGNYVCINRAWFDDNAIVFAKWWNDNGRDGYDGSLFGNLKWDDSQKILVTDTKDVSSDGVDRLHKILQKGAKCFYIAVCKSLEALESSHKDVKNKCNRYLKAAKKYNVNTTKGREWFKMMVDIASIPDNTWFNINVPANSNGKVTNLAQVKDFQKQLATDLNKLDERIETYCSDIEALVNNTDTSKWWGFSDDVRSTIKKSVKQFRTSSTGKMKNFKKNVNLALTKTIESKDGDLKILKDLKNINFN